MFKGLLLRKQVAKHYWNFMPSLPFLILFVQINVDKINVCVEGTGSKQQISLIFKYFLFTTKKSILNM